jgi:3-deoxy-D-manno-octulosonate 8-phosphate phosphatase (KDO 8-P phosphatase)
MSDSLHERCAAIEMLVLDVDGVLTDGRIVYSDRDEEIKAFHVRDGAGIKFWLHLGKRVGVITGRTSRTVDRRARELGVTAVVQGAEDKRAAFDQMLRDHGVQPAQVCTMGDDLPDVPLLRQSGLAITVADACSEAKAAAHHVTQAPGGRGAVREAIEFVLRAQGRWHEVLARFEGS